MLTAQSAPADIQRAIQLGARDYIGKPFETRQLLRRVDRMLHA
jgi:DNA-binding response OmpR family regulator